MKTEEILHSAEKFRIKLGLERILKILELLGRPDRGLKVIHVAGTNGKGSICAILESILIEAEFKTGKFTSPHLFKYNERISVNGCAIGDLELDEIINGINELDKKEKIGLTEFEILTAAGFWYFKKMNCDVVILEVGLGGRFDATNAVEQPILSIIGSISLEHTERLGDTIEKIAKEKAGIIKEGHPVVVLKENRGFQTIKEENILKNGVLHETGAIKVKEEGGQNFAYLGGKWAEFGLSGDFQGENLALCLKAVEIINFNENFGRKIGNEAVLEGIKKARWPFRLQKRGKVLIDACHNPDGARVLREYLDKNYKNKKIKFIFGCLKNKNYREVLGNLLSKNPPYKGFLAEENFEKDDKKELFFYGFNYPNALKYEELPEYLKKNSTEINKIQEEIKNDKNFDLTVVCGSIYMLGQVFKENLP